MLAMLLGIWLVLCWQVPGLNPLLCAVVYADELTMDAIHDFGEATLQFSHEVFLVEKKVASTTTLFVENHEKM